MNKKTGRVAFQLLTIVVLLLESLKQDGLRYQPVSFPIVYEYSKLTLKSSAGIVLIPPERLPSLNRSTEEDFVEVEKGSISGYIGEIEVFHHLHCLNFVRQYIWSESYNEDQLPSLLNHEGERSGEVNKLHASHCIEVMRQALMCNADLTPYLMFKTPGEASPVTEDFNASHKCKKFDRIMDWMKANSAAEEWAEIRKELFDHGH